MNTCSRYAVRYGETVEHAPGQYAKPPLEHWYFSSSFNVCWTTGRIFAVSTPGSENASPRSAASSSASARDPSLFGAAVRILDEIARAFAETDHRRRRQLDVEAAEAGYDAGRNGQLSRRRSRRRPWSHRRRRRFPARRAPRRESRPRRRRVSLADLDRHLHARAADRPACRVEPALRSTRRREIGSVCSAAR